MRHEADSCNTTRMARPRRFTEKIMARFQEGTLARVDTVLKPNEDHPSFVRRAVELETALRSREWYGKLAQSLLVGESEVEFCVKAIGAALERRRAALAQAEYVASREPLAREDVPRTEIIRTPKPPKRR